MGVVEGAREVRRGCPVHQRKVGKSRDHMRASRGEPSRGSIEVRQGDLFLSNLPATFRPGGLRLR